MKNKVILGALFLILILMFLALIRINEDIRPQIASIASAEANNAASKVVQHSIESIQFDTQDLIHCLYDDQQKVIGISYNTEKLNMILNQGLDAASTSLEAASLGQTDPNTHVLYYDSGIIYSIHLGYFTHIALFSEMGPKINVRFRIMHTSSGEIQVTTTPYGINSTLVKIEMVILTEMLVITPFLMNTETMECRIPLVIQVIQGDIPQMMLERIA